MRIVLLLIVLVLPICVFAQSYDEGLSHHQLGAEGSMLTGAGVTYSYIFDSLYRVKSTLWAYYQDNGDGSSNWTGSVGLEFQRTFFTTENIRFYGLVGGFYFTHVNTGTNVNYFSNGTSISNSYSSAEHDFAAGFGIGLEVMIWKHVAMNFDGVFEFAGVSYNPRTPPPSRYLGPSGGIGIAYRF